MNKKYKLTKETKEYYGITFYRIEALKDFCDVKRGDKGGWIKEENNLSQDDNCWVFGNAQVSGDARVYGNALVSGDAQVSGDAWVYGNALVYKLKLTSGYFYHTKEKSETIEKIEQDNYEVLCSKPKLAQEEKIQGKMVKIKVKDGGILEGEIIENDC